jgi:hypothetical protein
VLFFPDGDLRPDTITPDSLSQYRTLILPDCRYLTPAQAQLLGEYLENDGRLLVMGELGTNLTQADREAILNHPGTRQVEVGAQFDLTWLPFGQQVQISIPADIAVNLQRVDGGLALHILRYDSKSWTSWPSICICLAISAAPKSSRRGCCPRQPLRHRMACTAWY